MIPAQSQFPEYPVQRPARRLRLSWSRSCLPGQTACQALGFALLLAVPCGAQIIRPSAPSLPTEPSGAPLGSLEDRGLPSSDPVERARQVRAYNAERQKSLVSDTNKLLKLARELDEEVARAKPDSLTPAQLHKVAEIEKLARGVKEKMGSSGPGRPAFPVPLMPQLQ
jgi:hypothetical protein